MTIKDTVRPYNSLIQYNVNLNQSLWPILHSIAQASLKTHKKKLQGIFVGLGHQTGSHTTQKAKPTMAKLLA